MSESNVAEPVVAATSPAPARVRVLDFVLGIVVLFVVQAIVGAVIAATTLGAGAGKMMLWVMIAGAYTSAATMIGWAWFTTRLRRTGSMAETYGLTKVTWRDARKGVTVALGLWAIIAVMSVLFSFVTGNPPAENTMVSIMKGQAVVPAVLLVLYATLVAPVAEEVFFRGLLMRALGTLPSLQGNPRRAAFAIVGSALPFGLLHITTSGWAALPAVASAILAGVIFGVLAWRTGKITPGIVAHICYNSLAIAFMFISTRL